jgi:hypothetical protein
MLLSRRALSTLLSLAATSLLAIGCSASADDVGEEEGAATPTTKATEAVSAFEQAAVCDALFRDRSAFRDIDLAEGVLRWKCGDVPGVSISKCEDDLEALRQAEEDAKSNVNKKRDAALAKCGDGFGQEYCEYNAVANGHIVNSPTAVAKLKLKDSDTVQCLFTSVYSDVMDDGSTDYRTMVGQKLVSSGTLTGATSSTVLEPRASGMRQSVNSRGAADTLLADCSNLANQASHKDQDGKLVDHQKAYTDAQRQTACYRAWAKAQTGGDATRTGKLADACGGKIIKVKSSDGKMVAHRAGVDLSDDAAWAKVTALGVAVDDTNDADHDVSACMMVRFAENGGVPWRNSDPTICARSFRVAHECGNGGFGNIPAGGDLSTPAPTDLRFDGFEIRGWTNRDQPPPGCKYALENADGSPYTRALVCTPLAADVKQYKTQKIPLQQLCRDKFGANVAMQAPVGLLAKGPLKEETPFCKAFAAGARKISGK